jgi:hypothetical protein
MLDTFISEVYCVVGCSDVSSGRYSQAFRSNLLSQLSCTIKLHEEDSSRRRVGGQQPGG